MVGDVVAGHRQDAFEGEFSALGVDADPLVGVRRQFAEDAEHLSTSGLDEAEFFFKVAVVVEQLGGVEVFVGGDEGRLVQGEDAFHAVGQDRLEVGDVGDDLENRPLALDGAGGLLGKTDGEDGLTELLGSGGVTVEKFGKAGLRKHERGP